MIARLVNGTRNDMRFQFAQGFYYIYMFITFVYMLIIGVFPREYANYVIPILIFLDPSVIGLFFIGGIIMLEREQGVSTFLQTTPLRVSEYIGAKVISLTILANMAGLAIAITAKGELSINYPILILGISLSSVCCILVGVIASIGCKGINNYIVRMIPISIIMIIPCLSLGFEGGFWKYVGLFPSVLGLNIILKSFYNNEVALYMCILILVIFDLLLFLLVTQLYKVKSLGGEY